VGRREREKEKEHTSKKPEKSINIRQWRKPDRTHEAPPRNATLNSQVVERTVKYKTTKPYIEQAIKQTSKQPKRVCGGSGGGEGRK
jgi:hypothetical protein